VRMEFFGDSYDVVKRFLLQTLAPGVRWDAFPMFTHDVGPEGVAAFEGFLGVRVASMGVLKAGGDRSAHLLVAAHHRHVFLDPDTGIKLKPCRGAMAVHYVFGPELVEICLSEPGRLALVFDQSVPRGGERQAMLDKLEYFKGSGVHGFAYWSHACFAVLSASEKMRDQAHGRMLASCLPGGRILE
jgi:hypothetical protein